MERILITGCSGFLSSYLYREFVSGNYSLYGITEIDDFSSDAMEVIKADIRDKKKLDEVIRDIKPDIIYHLAAISNVGFSWKNPGLTYEVNFIGSTNLLESTLKYSPRTRIVLMSSAEVYSQEKSGKINEFAKISPENPYSLSKYAMEMAADLYLRSEKLEIIKIRSFNFTGPGQNNSFVSADFASQIAKIEKGEREPVIKVGNLSAKRDFSDVRDISRYLSVLGKKGKSGEIYNICSGSVHSIEEILHMLLEFAKMEIRIETDKEKFRPVDSPLLWGDNSKINREFGLSPAFDMKTTLFDLLEYERAKK